MPSPGIERCCRPVILRDGPTLLFIPHDHPAYFPCDREDPRHRRGPRTLARMSDDLVCSAARDDVEVVEVLRTERVLAFLDHRPVFKGHVLVCPLPHADDLMDLSPDAVGPFFAEVQRVSAAVVAALGCQGTFVAMNNRVSQSVPHLHCHVVPRTKGDGLRGFFWPRTTYAAGEAEAYASQIRAALAD